MPKFTHTPAYCAACFQQDSELRHIDFDAAYDGPVLTLEDGRKQPIDDLVLCERCLNSAFALLDPDGLRPEVERLHALLALAKKDIEVKDRIINRYHKTNEELIEHPVQKTKASGHLIGLPEEVHKEVYENRRKRAENKKKRAERKATAVKG